GGVEAGHDLGQDVKRVGNRTTVAARVEVLVGPVDVNLAGGQPPAGDGQAALVGAEHAAVGTQDHITLEELPVLLEEGAQVGAADLLLPFQEELDVDRRGTLQIAQGLHAFDGLKE